MPLYRAAPGTSVSWSPAPESAPSVANASWFELLAAARTVGQSVQTEAASALDRQLAETEEPPARTAQASLRVFSSMLQDVDGFGAEGSTCAICLGADATEVTELRCGNRHRFHKSCISTWMVASVALNNGAPRCPLCRKRLNFPETGVRRDVLDLSLQELSAVERLLQEVRWAVLEQRVVIAGASPEGGEADGPSPAPWPQLRAAQARTVMLEDRVAELRSAVFELQSRLSLL